MNVSEWAVLAAWTLGSFAFFASTLWRARGPLPPVCRGYWIVNVGDEPVSVSVNGAKPVVLRTSEGVKSRGLQ